MLVNFQIWKSIFLKVRLGARKPSFRLNVEIMLNSTLKAKNYICFSKNISLLVFGLLASLKPKLWRCNLPLQMIN